MVSRSKRIPVAVVLLSSVLGGCAAMNGVPQPIQSTDELREQMAPYLRGDILGTYAAKQGSEQVSFRNEVVLGRIAMIDANYRDFVVALSRESRTGNIGADFALLGLSTGTILSQGARAKEVLSALSGGLVGAKSSLDKNAYYDSTVPALVAQMTAARKQILARILRRLTDPGYSLIQALVDLQEYEYAGSLPGALQQITARAGNDQSDAADSIQKLSPIALNADDVSQAKLDARDSLLDRIDALRGEALTAVATNVKSLSDLAPLFADPKVAALDTAVEGQARALLRLAVAQSYGNEKLFSQLQAVIGK